MIVVLFGQPGSGKTTLAQGLLADPKFPASIHIDGDKLRKLFQNKDFSREGRIKNLKTASDIAVFINSMSTDVIVSVMYPYQEARDYLDSLCDDVKWIYLVYDEPRGREQFHLKEFETSSNGIKLNTSTYSIEECLQIIKDFLLWL
jgi:adenylylsulfate kinase-like enzyme